MDWQSETRVSVAPIGLIIEGHVGMAAQGAIDIFATFSIDADFSEWPIDGTTSASPTTPAIRKIFQALSRPIFTSP